VCGGIAWHQTTDGFRLFKHEPLCIPWALGVTNIPHSPRHDNQSNQILSNKEATLFFWSPKHQQSHTPSSLAHLVQSILTNAHPQLQYIIWDTKVWSEHRHKKSRSTLSGSLQNFIFFICYRLVADGKPKNFACTMWLQTITHLKFRPASCESVKKTGPFDLI
jgi:hypothetical protein